MKSIVYKGLTIESQPMWYPDKKAFGAMGTIGKFPLGNDGARTYKFSTAIDFCSEKSEANEKFFEFGKKFIDDNSNI